MAASMNFSLAAAVLLSGLLILGAVQATEAVVACPPSIMCAQGSYVTCANTCPGSTSTGLLIMSAVEPSDAAGVCSIMCAQGTYVTCANRPGQNFTGRCACDQQCAPPGCGGCRAHLGDVSTAPVRG
ncbi:hypothetical protein PR202_gb11066 [Eleusine coracana subsp. coracana]|uniref:Uncharacterized protein n=1 Tax=Eleusine coracana subsp. coracana TaxID=191504 RepID=A0AAV5EL04_ELECO|nr:hypothetical protein PR202_gb11066 [Eleusine coracana subsp. coracana]